MTVVNRQNPHGFTPAGHLTGGEVRVQTVSMLNPTNSAIYIGDPLMQVTGGFLDLWTSGNPVAGISAGKYIASNYGGTAVGAVDFYQDPQIIYRAQTDTGTGSNTTQAALTLNANITNAGTAGTNGINSAATLANAGGTTATLPMKIIGIVPAPPEQNQFGEYNDLLCVINSSIYHAGVLGV